MSTNLLDLQRRMANAVMQPLTRSLTTRRLGNDGQSNARNAEEFLKPNPRLTSIERLQIYNQQYWYRLFGCMEEDFPGVQAVMGPPAFERLMRAYLEACPSASYSLRDLGARLPEWMRAHPKLTAPRARLALDMARLEWAHIEAFDAAELPVLTPQTLATLRADARVRVQPHVRLLQLAYPVDELLLHMGNAAADHGATSNSAAAARKSHSVRRVASLHPQRIHLAVHRQEFRVYYKRLAAEEFALLTALRSEEPLGAALEAAFIKSRLSEPKRAAQVQTIFQTWMKLGWLCPQKKKNSRSQR